MAAMVSRGFRAIAGNKGLELKVLVVHHTKMVINSPYLTDKKELAIPWKTTTGKEFSNPLMADSLRKTIFPTKLVE
ncbi:hypothetical protein Tco_0766183 [Tanacetum coccineum]